MPDDIVIRFENVSKRYKRIFGGLRHLVQDTANKLLGRNDDGPPEERYLWALKDVSFEVHRGEILGIIGLNGSGKSTILKLASRITYSTTGSIDIKGTVGALIEVGAGFHPELTGQENVFLNASILGMARQEIEEKYDSIVEFAELDGFMDMPVKRYSSGMYVRLGFAVAAHLNPDVFLIDEVLAVGDSSFRSKCTNKIKELREQDITIILVSHNMVDIARHTDRALWVDGGRIRAVGNPDEIIDEYLTNVLSRNRSESPAVIANSDLMYRDGRMFSDGRAAIESVVMTKADGGAATKFDMGEAAQVHITYHAKEPIDDPIFMVAITDESGRQLSIMSTKYDDHHIDHIEGRGTITFQVESLIVLRGNYYINLSIRDGSSLKFIARWERAVVFSVHGPALSNPLIGGDFILPHKWLITDSHSTSPRGLSKDP